MLGSLKYDEARSYAANMRESAKAMTDLLAELKKEMDSLESVLKSKGADELYSTYKTLEAKVGSYPEKVIEFASFLESTVAKYEYADQTLQNSVN